MLFALVAFLGGVLSFFSPCVLPLLPIFASTFVSSSAKFRFSLALLVSTVCTILCFTLLVKTTSLAFTIDPHTWSLLGGILLILAGLSFLLPTHWFYNRVSHSISNKAHLLVQKAFDTQNSVWRPVMIGAAVGLLYTSCSPAYIFILGSILPHNITVGSFYLLLYLGGFATVFVLFFFLLSRFQFSHKQLYTTLQKSLWFFGILCILIGIAAVTGYLKIIEQYLLSLTPSFLLQFEQKLLPR